MTLGERQLCTSGRLMVIVAKAPLSERDTRTSADRVDEKDARGHARRERAVKRFNILATRSSG